MGIEYALPASWAAATLAEVGEIVSGGTPSTKDPANFDGDIAWLTPADLSDHREKVILRGKRNLSEKGLRSCSARLMPKGSVLFSSRAPIGYVAIAGNELATNQGFKSVVPANGIDESYLYFWLKSAKRMAEQQASGTTFKEISGSRFAKLSMPVPPLAEQQRIVEKIETLFAELDKGEESLRKVQTLLARYRQSVLKAAVTGAPDLGTQKVQLGSLLEDIRYGTAKKCRVEPGGVAVLRIPNVVTGKIDLQDLKFTDLDSKEMARLALTEGDVLLVRSNGSASLVGRTAVVDDRASGMAFAGYLIRLRVDRNRLLPEFLQIVMNSPTVRAKIERQARSTSGVHNINSSEVKAIEFDLPPLPVQSDIVALVGRHFAHIESLETACKSELSRSAALRQSILKDAFSGRLVPQDPNDEPASELLARIRQSRAADKEAPRRNS